MFWLLDIIFGGIAGSMGGRRGRDDWASEFDDSGTAGGRTRRARKKGSIGFSWWMAPIIAASIFIVADFSTWLIKDMTTRPVVGVGTQDGTRYERAGCDSGRGRYSPTWSQRRCREKEQMFLLARSPIFSWRTLIVIGIAGAAAGAIALATRGSGPAATVHLQASGNERARAEQERASAARGAQLGAFQQIVHELEQVTNWFELPAGQPVVLEVTWGMVPVPLRLMLGDSRGWYHDVRIEGGSHQVAFVPHAERVCIWVNALEDIAAPISIKGELRAASAGSVAQDPGTAAA